MKKIKILIAAIVGVIVALGCSACVSTEGKKYDYLITFDYNTEKLNFDTLAEDQYLGVTEKYPYAFAPGETSLKDKFPEATIQNYYVEGWYLPQLDGEGKPVTALLDTGKTDEEGNPITKEYVLLDMNKKWDFKSPVTQNMTLYANVLKNPVLTLVVDGGKNLEIPGKIGEALIQPNANNAPKLAGHTLYGYYYDEDRTIPVDWTGLKYESDVTFYTKFIEGEWRIVRTATAFVNAVKIAGANVYLDADIDFSANAWVVRQFAGKLNGNGHKITNVTLTSTGEGSDQLQPAGSLFDRGLFSKLAATASIYDVTFENVQLTFNTGRFGTHNVSLFAYMAEAGAQMTNVTFTNCAVVEGTLYGSPAINWFPLFAVGDKDGVTLTNVNVDGITLPN